MPPPYGSGFPLGSPRTIVGSDTGFGMPGSNARGYGSGSETSVFFVSSPNGPPGSKALTSVDGGLTWAPVPALPAAPVTDRLAFDADLGRLSALSGPGGTIAANNGLFSDDLGLTWAPITKPSNARFGGVTSIPSLGEIWSVAFGVAQIHRSTDGGATWVSTAGPADCTGQATDGVDFFGNAYFSVVGGFAVRSPNGIAYFLAVGVNGGTRDVLAVPDFGLVLASNDNTIKSSPNGGFGAAYIDRAVMAAATPIFAYSPSLGLCTCISTVDQRNSVDGINWVDPGAAPVMNARDALWSEIWGCFIYVGNAGSSRIFRSEDGINWVATYTTPGQPNLGDLVSIVECVI